MMHRSLIFPPIVRVTCVVPWCRAVRYVESAHVTTRAVEHWEQVHPRRLRAARERGRR